MSLKREPNQDGEIGRPQPGTVDWLKYVGDLLSEGLDSLWDRVQGGFWRDPEEARAAVNMPLAS